MSVEPTHPRGAWFDPPSLGADEVGRIARDQFGVTGAFTPLRGERDQNTLIKMSEGRSFVLKIAGPHEDPATIDFQCRALEHIARTDPEFPVPRVIPDRDGHLHVDVVIDDAGTTARARLLTFLHGRTFDDAGMITLAGLHGIGRVQGRLARALSDFEHDASAAFMPWALDSGLLASRELWESLHDDACRLVEPCRQRVDIAVRALPGLRRHVIHNDAHRGNLLRRSASPTDETVVGVIDFGDLVESAAAADLGVSGASFVGDQADPGAAMIEMAVGYDSVRRLEPDEVEMLPDLVLCRLVLSALMTDFQIANSPHIASAVITERPAIHATLRRWIAIDSVELSQRLHEEVAHRRGQEKP